jgi:tRNA-specific 2-thiouridylase
VRCNQRIKFHDLLATARELGADALATGHYVRRLDGPRGPELHRAVDADRDQSYFLFATTPAQLDLLRFPLGDLHKAATRDIAARLGLAVAAKPDSQDICFVPQGDYAAVVAKLRPGAAEPGEIVDLDGRVLGRHDGVIGYTVGQRRGLGIGGRRDGEEVGPLYVVRLEPAARRVVVGPRSALARRTVRLSEVNWIGDGPLNGGTRVAVKLRNTGAPAPATLAATDDGADVTLHDPQHGVAPGQACVFYALDGDRPGSRVLGGGWIRDTA